MLKKSLKKMLLATSTIAVLSAATITPIALLSTDNNSSNYLLNSLNQRAAITNSGYAIGDGGMLELASTNSANAQGQNVNITNPNITKAVPNGYIIPVGKSGQVNNIVLVDKNDPLKILWYSLFDSSSEILSTEYLPFNDSLVVLYRVGGVEANSRAEIKVRVFNNISQTTSGSELQGTDVNVTSYTYTEDGNNFSRADLWTMSPVMYYTVAAEEIVIYQKHWYADSEQKLFVFNINDNSINEIQIDANIYEESILSTQISKYDSEYCFVAIKAVDRGDHTAIVTYLNKFNINDNSANKVVDEYIREDSNLFSKDNKLDIIKSSVSVAGAYANTDGGNVTSAMLINTPCLGSIPYRAPYIVRIQDWNRDSTSFDKVTQIPLFSSNISYDDGVELWNGQFNNMPILKKGMTVAYGNGGSSLIGNGYSKNLGGNYTNFFSFVIKDSTSSKPGNVAVNGDINDSSIRVYPFANEADKYGSLGYIPVDYVDNDDFSYHLNAPAGFSIAQYNDSAEALSNPFNDVIIHGANGTNKAITINQANRGQKIGVATYDFYSQLKNTSAEVQGSNKLITEVDADYLVNTYGLNGSYLNISFADQLGFENYRADAIIALNPDSIQKDIKNGTLTVDLYSTILYDDQGKILKASLSDIQANWSNYNAHKIATITLTGFRVWRVTKFNKDSVSLGDSIIWPSEYYENDKDNQRVQELMFNNKDMLFTDLPDDFDASNIIIKHVKVDNVSGSLIVTYALNNYYNSQADLITNSDSTQHTLTIKGYAKKEDFYWRNILLSILIPIGAALLILIIFLIVRKMKKN